MSPMKLILPAILLLTSITALLNLETPNPEPKHQLTLTYDENSTSPIDKNTLSEVLNNIHDENMRCLYRSGINDQSFEQCCGENYKKIQDRYLAVYQQEEKEMVDEFRAHVLNSCEYDKSACETLLEDFEDVKRKNRDLVDELVISKEQLQDQPGVKSDELDIAFKEFEHNYVAFKNARILISNRMNQTVKDIKNLISRTGVKLRNDYRKYDPEFQFTELEVRNEDDSDVEVDTLHELDGFNKGFLAEANAKKQIDTYLVQGFVTPDEVNKGELPSAQLERIKNIIRERKKKIGL